MGVAVRVEKIIHNRVQGERLITNGSATSKPMKIVFLVRTLGMGGGSERQVVELAKGLSARGIKVSIGVFHRKKAFSYDGELRSAGVSIYYMNKKNRWNLLGFLLNAIRFSRRESPNVMYSFASTATNIFGCVMKLFVPRMYVVWSVRGSMKPKDGMHLLTRMYYWLEELLSGRSDLIIANSNAGFNYALTRGFPRERIMVIPNGFDVERFRPEPGAREALRAEWGFKNGTKVVGMVARHDPVKDHPTFLRAAASIAERHPDVQFVCLGGKHSAFPEYHDVITNLASELQLESRVIWAGVRSDMPAVYNAIDVLCSSSISEGLSNVIGEAMACGVPCVVTNVGDSARVVGDLGVVVLPGEPKALAKGLEEMLERIEGDKKAKIGRQVRKRIMEQFSYNPLIDNTIKAFRDLM